MNLAPQALSVNKFLEDTPRSGIRRIADKLTELDLSTGEIIQLGLGQPQESTPEVICQAASQAALSGFTKYTPNAGITELRQELRGKLAEFNDCSVDLEDIYITPGATYGISIAIGSLINPGDEVLVPDPGYPNFAAAVAHYGGKVKYYTLERRYGFQLDVDSLAPLVSARTKLLIINSPSNPTGAVFASDTIKKLVEFTREKGLWFLADEVYEAFVYSGGHRSALSGERTEHVVGIYSFSKTYIMTGLRVGYIVTRNKRLKANLLKAQELYISCAPSVSQRAALQALKHCDSFVEQLKNKFRTKRDIAMSLLKGQIGYIPQGAFYFLLDIGKTGLSSDAFADMLLDKKRVAVAPGSTFGPSADRYIRVAYTAEHDLVREGVGRIKELIHELSRQPAGAKRMAAEVF